MIMVDFVDLVRSNFYYGNQGHITRKKPCLHLTNSQISTKLTQINHWEDLDIQSDFVDLDLNFKASIRFTMKWDGVRDICFVLKNSI